MGNYNGFVAKHTDAILAANDYFWKNPETGYREWKTHAYLAKAFEDLGYTVTPAGNIPGFTALVDTGKPGPKVAVFGELDALLCASHPEADPETGAVHACGHSAQAAALLGLAMALKEPGVLEGLCGSILLVAVPAEELIEVQYRQELYDQGIIRYFGGKPEFLYRGLLDGVDLSMMIHTTTGKRRGFVCPGSNGCVVKNVRFLGKASHAGGYPEGGINALYAANLALSAINALRETFSDNAHIRVHPIITAGGSSVNAIPDDVQLEAYVRGANMQQINGVNQKVNRAIAASAAAMGAKAQIRDIPGYWPRRHTEDSRQLMYKAMELAGVEVERNSPWMSGCSDMGDISAVMPALHPHISGASGTAHGKDYAITDPQTACVTAAAVLLNALALLLQEEGKAARQIVADYKPEFAHKEAYFAYADNLRKDLESVTYQPDGTVKLTYQ